MRNQALKSLTAIALPFVLHLTTVSQISAQTLVGYASLPADTFAPGPTAGQFIGGGANGRTAPFVDKQPVQGFSAILDNGDGTFWMLSDNGFGSKANSPDYALRLYKARPNFRTEVGGDASVEVLEHVSLSDPNRLVPFKVIADLKNYPAADGADSGIPVHSAITQDRLLTGFDFDVESMRRDASGNIWIGDEFGPFLLKFNAKGELLRAPIPIEDIASPDDPLGRKATHPRSGGFEGMSANLEGTVLYPMLEKPTHSDSELGLRRLRIMPFDTVSETYSGDTFYYPLDPKSSAIGDFSPISDNLHLVIERDGKSGSEAEFKKIYLVDFGVRDANNQLVKRELVDLLNVADPHDLDQDRSHVFTFPFVTIEDVVAIDANTIAVANDNNYPFSAGRAPKPIIDNNEFILIHFDEPLAKMTIE